MTDCVETPQGVYPDEPARPKTVSDEYIKALVGWGNQVLGIATTDRILWRGERRCINKMREAGQIR